MNGLFLAVEGPNGVGKTTTVTRLAELLRQRGHTVHVTTEPSDTPLGRLIRSSETALTGRAMALAVAADRYAHIDTEINPALADGKIVISDRYVQSSLVLQRLDELPLKEIWQYNAHVPPTSLSCYLRHSAHVIQQRLDQRQHHSRLERAGSPAREAALYEDAYVFLAARGWCQVWIDCRELDVDGVAARLLQHMERLRTR
ncbi:dTMP kinase [Nonomuraea roseoviolacea]|uniref:Thymidylate kinase n=1 Tax=Nonomuraea roseoviolacea subsp. carminata TaxID=160689 RepID=A0ABT1JWE5_9ACTN|nr:dTMP kinase [Nonomuraea roseoviolacea]MCP2345561.1 dTMP kinase [Nonomuraea roseoviolacea subsp. carminata]